MGSEVSTIQSLKAVDAWIDVINANINGGVRTAFKSSRLKFSGSNTDVVSSGNSTSLPLQFPEPGLTTANTVIDFSQGAITASTENTHLAIQGEGFFMLFPPSVINANGGYTPTAAPITVTLLTRDGEFRTNQQGLLVAANGWYLAVGQIAAAGTGFASSTSIRAVYNDLDNPPSAAMSQAIRLSDFQANNLTAATLCADGLTAFGNTASSMMKVINGRQNMRYSQYGSSYFDYGNVQTVVGTFPEIRIAAGTTGDGTILTKSLEASNSSMTQSVPELSLAQKLFSALTKVLQTKQTNVDGVLNLVR